MEGSELMTQHDTATQAEISEQIATLSITKAQAELGRLAWELAQTKAVAETLQEVTRRQSELIEQLRATAPTPTRADADEDGAGDE